ncbi:MAG TPA: hypothetical protein DEA08_14225 [Planctomycetes bacterium]|nr:hypothetical protein [Planctomycetota bacterium]
MNKLKQVRDFLCLPGDVTEFEESFLRRLNRLALGFFCLHLPVFVAIAYFNETGALAAVALTLLALFGPALAVAKVRNQRAVSLVHGFSSMIFGGLLVHFGQGPVQIEMHFYFFAMLAMLSAFGNPLVVLTAAVTVTFHHLLLWIYLPSSVFNYQAPFWVVLVHAAFVVLESVVSCFLARSFFDNVIGLEKKVQERTRALDQRNHDMRLVLDNVDQGFLTIDTAGVLSPERSAAVDVWLGAPSEAQGFAEYLSRVDERVGMSFELGWEQVVDGFLPLDVALDQLPHELRAKGRVLEIGYTPITIEGELQKMLVVISDVTATRERLRLEAEQRETAQILDRVMSDKSGFLEFYGEVGELVRNVAGEVFSEDAPLKRALHTIKGNCMIYGLDTVAERCHELESQLDERGQRPSELQREDLGARWERLEESLSALLGDRDRELIEIEGDHFQRLLEAALGTASRAELANMIASLKLEPTSSRLRRVAEQARRIAKRIGQGEIGIEIDDQDLRLEPSRWSAFWSAFIHVVRNAVDHGLEPPELRAAAGKEGAGCLRLTTAVVDGEFQIAVSDDGRGIDWEAVAEKARGLGLPAETHEELVDALFAEGLSTAQRITETSGRGVGMAAVMEAVEAQGGRVEVESEAGQGTTFRFRFPAKQMAPRPEALLLAA